MGENDRVGERQGTMRASRERNAGDELTIIRLHSVASCALDDGQCSAARQLSTLQRVFD